MVNHDRLSNEKDILLSPFISLNPIPKTLKITFPIVRYGLSEAYEDKIINNNSKGEF